MPFAQSPRYSSPDRLANEILWSAHPALYESVKQTILKTCKKWWCKPTLCEKRMGFGLSVSVNEDLGVVAIRSHQDSIVVYLLLGEAGFVLDDLQKLVGGLAQSHHTQPFFQAYVVGDAVSEFCNLNLSLFFSPLGFNSVN
jgi:hypothetical protein